MTAAAIRVGTEPTTYDNYIRYTKRGAYQWNNPLMHHKIQPGYSCEDIIGPWFQSADLLLVPVSRTTFVSIATGVPPPTHRQSVTLTGAL